VTDTRLARLYRSSQLTRTRQRRCDSEPRLSRGCPDVALLPDSCGSTMPDSADLSRVLALSNKGNELERKGHDARAAEKFSRAAEEAEQACPHPDSLVTCALRIEQLNSLLRHASSPAAPADADDALREACLRLLPSVLAVVERRKAAGTLLPGSCSPVEEAYHMAVKRHDLEHCQGCPQAIAAELAAVLAKYVGLETYFCVAANVAYMLCDLDFLKSAFVLSDEQKHAAYLFLASAVDLMTPQRDYEGWLFGEPELVNHLRDLIPALSELDNPEAKLCAAWRRVLRSGVLRARGIDEGIEASNQLDASIRAATRADLAAGRLQQCALACCAARESHASQFKRCGACRTVCYCCREHQVEDWSSHKAACKAARTAAADPAGASGA